MAYKPKVKDWKKEEVERFTKLFDEYDIIGVLNMKNLPARQLQNMRGQLRDTVFMRMTKKRLLKLALEKSSKKNIDKLFDHMKGMPAILFSNENPFKLYSILKRNKSKAPIKGGQEAPNDIVIPKGPTSFPPGPIIGELGSMGIPAGVEEGKVAVQKDTTVAKEGEEVSAELAGILTRLGIEPMEVGLDLVAVYEDGEILTKSVLDIDVDEYINNIQSAAAQAFNLAFNAGYTTKDNIELMITKAHSDALGLATSEDILTDETVKTVLAKAEGQAKALDSKIDIDSKMQEEKKEEPAEKEEKTEDKEEKKEESKPEEEAKEDSNEEKEESDEKQDDKESEDSDEKSSSTDSQ